MQEVGDARTGADGSKVGERRIRGDQRGKSRSPVWQVVGSFSYRLRIGIAGEVGGAA